MHKRIWGSINRRPSQDSEQAIPNGDSPEASVARGVRLFCESGGPNNSGEEVLHLPTIVDAAECSPAAATEASIRIRKFLSKDNYQRAYVQYNAIMLMRILADNPGKSFTKNIDQKFINTIKELLRDGRDMSVQQILRETLDSFEQKKGDDETLTLVNEMWKKEQAKILKRGGRLDGGRSEARNIAPPPFNPNQQYNRQHNYFATNHKQHGLPSPAELAQRVQEAKTSAKLLSQVVQSTPPREVLGNELIKEFVERCQSATRSMQTYINSDDPPPDEDTLLTLIETNDQLATSMSKYQRAMLQARKLPGAVSATPSPNPPSNQTGPFEAPANPPSGPPRSQSYKSPQGPPPGKETLRAEEHNPFDDHNESDRGEDRMQDDMAPQFGMPPSNMGKENVQPGSYRPGYQSNSSYSNGHNAVAGSKAVHNGYGHDEDYDEEEVVRKPVQYRF